MVKNKAAWGLVWLMCIAFTVARDPSFSKPIGRSLAQDTSASKEVTPLTLHDTCSNKIQVAADCIAVSQADGGSPKESCCGLVTELNFKFCLCQQIDQGEELLKLEVQQLKDVLLTCPSGMATPHSVYCAQPTVKAAASDLGIAKSNPGFSLDSDAELEIDFFVSSSLEGPQEEEGEWRIETDTFGDDISVDSDEYDNTEYAVDLDITLDSTVYDEYDGQEDLGGSVSDYSAGELSVEYSDSGADFGVDLTVDVDAAADAFGVSSEVAEALFRKSDKDFDLHISKGDDEGFEKIPKRSGAKPWMPKAQDSNSDVSIDFNVQIEEGSWAGEDLTPLKNTAGQPDADNSADMTINFDVNVEIESDSDPMISSQDLADGIMGQVANLLGSVAGGSGSGSLPSDTLFGSSKDHEGSSADVVSSFLAAIARDSLVKPKGVTDMDMNLDLNMTIDVDVSSQDELSETSEAGASLPEKASDMMGWLSAKNFLMSSFSLPESLETAFSGLGEESQVDEDGSQNADITITVESFETSDDDDSQLSDDESQPTSYSFSVTQSGDMEMSTTHYEFISTEDEEEGESADGCWFQDLFKWVYTHQATLRIALLVQIALLALLLGGNFLYNHGLIHNWWGSNDHYGYQFLQEDSTKEPLLSASYVVHASDHVGGSPRLGKDTVVAVSPLWAHMQGSAS